MPYTHLPTQKLDILYGRSLLQLQFPLDMRSSDKIKKSKDIQSDFFLAFRLRKNIPLTYIIIELLVASKRNYEVKIPTR